MYPSTGLGRLQYTLLRWPVLAVLMQEFVFLVLAAAKRME
jgi:hypothetical protein